MRIELPFPPKELSPNARVHWANKATAVRGYRLACSWLAVTQGAKKISARNVNATLTFHPPSRRRIDMDNMLARSKAAIDAVSELIGVDDSRWSLSLIRGEPRPKEGALVMEIEAA